MSYDVIDAAGNGGQIASSQGIEELQNLAGPALEQFLQTGNANSDLAEDIIQEVEGSAKTSYIVPLFRGKAPFILGNGIIEEQAEALKSLTGVDKNLRPVIEDRIRLFKEEFPEPAKLFGGIDTEEMEKDTLAYIGKNSGKYYLVLNTRYWGDAFDLTVLLIEAAGSDDTATYHVDTAEGTIDHELAHILDNWILANQAEGEHLGSDNPAWRTAGAKKLTRYAKEDPTEAFAEAFAMHQVYGIDAVKDPSLKLALSGAIAFAAKNGLADKMLER